MVVKGMIHGVLILGFLMLLKEMMVIVMGVNGAEAIEAYLVLLFFFLLMSLGVIWRRNYEAVVTLEMLYSGRPITKLPIIRYSMGVAIILSLLTVSINIPGLWELGIYLIIIIPILIIVGVFAKTIHVVLFMKVGGWVYSKFRNPK